MHKIRKFINDYEIFLCNITISHEIIFEMLKECLFLFPNKNILLYYIIF